MSSTSITFAHAGGSSPRRRRVPADAPATSIAADAAIRQIRDRRRKRHKYGVQAEPRLSPIEGAVSDVVSAFGDLRRQAGVPRWAVGAAMLVAAAFGAWVTLGPWLFPAGPPCPVHPVAGHVAIGKLVPAGAQIVLHPVGRDLPDLAVPRATVREDGSFVVSTFGNADGAPEGDYVVTVQWFRIGKDGSPGPNVLPSRYAKPDSSPIKVTVNAGRNELPALEVVR